MAMKRTFRFWASFTLIVLLGVCAALLTLNLNPIVAPWLSGAVSDTLGRAVSIDGPVHLRLWPGGVKLVAEDVRLANASWGSRPDMVTAGRVEVRAPVSSLFAGRFVVEELSIERADVLLETDYSGLTNRPRPGRLTLQDRVLTHVALEGPHRVRLKDIHIAYQAPDGARPFETTIERAELRPVLEGLKIELLGNFKGSLVAIDGTVEEPMALIRGARTRVELATAMGNTTVLIAGGLGSPWRGPGFDLRLDGKAADLRDFAALLGVPLTQPGADVTFTANLKMSGNVIDLEEFSSTVGGGNLVGEAHARFDDDGLASLEGVFASEQLDLAKTGIGAFTLAPLLSVGDLDAPWPLDWLRHVKFDISYQADALNYHAVALSDVDLRVLLGDGVLTAYPISARVEGAPADFEFAADFSLDTPTFELRAAAPGIAVDTVIRHAGYKPLIGGGFDFAAELRARGTTPAAALASLDGNGAAALSNGFLESGYVSKLPAEWRDALAAQGEGAERVDVSCAKGQLVFGNGYATSRLIFAESGSAVLAGAGTLDLASGALDAFFVPAPKESANRKAAKSYVVSGVLGEPKFTVAAPNARAVPRASSPKACQAAFASGLVLRLRDPTLIDPKTYEGLRLRGEDMSKYSVNKTELDAYRRQHPELTKPDKANAGPGRGE